MRRGVREGGSHRGVAAPKKHVPSLLERWKQEKVCDGPKGRAQKYEIDTTQSQTTTTGTILPRVAELSWSEIGPFTYNGEQQAPTATVANKVGTDDVSIIVAGAQTNVGTYVGSSAASVTELTGADEENYVMPASPDTMPFSITKADRGTRLLRHQSGRLAVADRQLRDQLRGRRAYHQPAGRVHGD